MRRLSSIFLICCAFAVISSAEAAGAHIIKVLPQFLDLKGRHARSPSLYDRDAYQAYLREHTNEVSGIRFVVQWKPGGANVPLKLRIELRGAARGELPPQMVLETEVKPGRSWFGHWADLRLTGDDYKQFGEVTAWRATLWDGGTLLSDQKSFLW